MCWFAIPAVAAVAATTSAPAIVGTAASIGFSWSAASFFAGLGMSAVGMGSQAYASVQQGRYAKAVAANQAKVARLQGEYAEAAGGAEAGRAGEASARLMARQRAIAAGQGFDVSVGDPVSIINSTARSGVREQWSAERSGQVAGWSRRVSARGYELEGSMRLSAAKSSAAGYGLLGAGQLFGGTYKTGRSLGWWGKD